MPCPLVSCNSCFNLLLVMTVGSHPRRPSAGCSQPFLPGSDQLIPVANDCSTSFLQPKISRQHDCGNATSLLYQCCTPTTLQTLHSFPLSNTFYWNCVLLNCLSTLCYIKKGQDMFLSRLCKLIVYKVIDLCWYKHDFSVLSKVRENVI